MSEAAAVRVDEAPVLTWEQICERYPDEWVVVVDIDHPPTQHQIRSARVVSHDRHRRPALEGARGIIGTRHTGSFFTGAKRGPRPGERWL